MTLLKRIESLLAVWRVMLPHIPAPTPEDTAHWLNYSDEIVEAAIFRTGKKFAAPKLSAGFDPSQAYRYATATARIMAERAQEPKVLA
jgi:hypothetical protein